MGLAAGEGTTIFFSSHQLHEVERIADHICIIDEGKATVTGSLDDLKCRYQRLQIHLDREWKEPVKWVAGVEHVQQNGRTVSILAAGNIDALLAQAYSLGAESVERFPVSLKEIFLEHARTN
jgi:ABC-2 type transport system ATP-binding protein